MLPELVIAGCISLIACWLSDRKKTTRARINLLVYLPLVVSIVLYFTISIGWVHDHEQGHWAVFEIFFFYLAGLAGAVISLAARTARDRVSDRRHGRHNPN